MQDKHTANILQEELKLALLQASTEFGKAYGGEFVFQLHEVTHPQKTTEGEKVPALVLTLNVLTTVPGLVGFHPHTDGVKHYKKLWQQAYELGKSLTESRVFGYRQLLLSCVMGLLGATLEADPETLDQICNSGK